MASLNNKYDGGIVLKRFFFYLGERAAFTTQIIVDYIDNRIKCITYFNNNTLRFTKNVTSSGSKKSVK